MAVPDIIKRLANKVRKEIYGKGVRESIAQSMEVTGETAEDAHQRSVEQLERVDRLIKENPQPSEVVDSRGEYPILRDRLDAADEKLSQTKILIRPSMTTEEIQNLLNTGKDFKFLSGEYNLEFSPTIEEPTCLDIPSDVSIEMEKGVVLNCPTNSFERYHIIRIRDKSNVSIHGGMLNGDRESHTGSTGEWGYGLLVYNSRNIELKNILSLNCWGDGFAVQNRSENVIMENCISDNNRRQGLTIGHVRNFKVKNCVFKNTNGTAPQAGVDIEPNTHGFIEDVVFENCKFLNNAGSGLEINIRAMVSNPADDGFLSIFGQDNIFESNNAGIVYTSGGGNPIGKLKGIIKLDSSILLNNTSGVRHANIRKNIMPRMVLSSLEIDGWNPYTWALQSYVDRTDDGASEINTVGYGGLEVYGLNLLNFSEQFGNPSTAVRLQSNSINRPLDVIIDDISGDEEDLGEYVYWNFGEGRITFQNNPTYKNHGSARGVLPIERLNGLAIDNPSGSSIRLPDAKNCKNRVFVFQYTNGNFFVRTKADSTNEIVGEGLFSTTYVEVRKGNRFVFKSDGDNKWFLIERTGAIKRSVAGGDRETFIYTSGNAPSSGTFEAGTLVLNYIPRSTSSFRLIGWYRITDGNEHILGIDWEEIWIPLNIT